MKRSLALTLTLALTLGMLPAQAAEDAAVFIPSAAPGVTERVTQVDTGIAGLTLSLGADDWTCESQDISVTSATGTQYTAFLVGKANPKPDEGTGTYYSFAFDDTVKTGSLELMYRLNSGKALYILDNGAAMPGFDGLVMEVGGDVSSTIIVEGGHTYTVYAKGSKLRLYGCSFRSVDPAQVFAEEIAAFPFSRIQGANADIGKVEEDLVLMDSYESQFGSCDVSWTSSAPKVIDTNGSVNMQKAQTSVTLTGHFQVQENRALKADVVFDVTVTADPDDASAVAAAKEALTLGDLSAVKRNLELPTAGKRGAAIAWASSDAKVVDAQGRVYPSAEKDLTATLTATLSRGSAKTTKVFEVTVAAMVPVVVDAWSYAGKDGKACFTPTNGGVLKQINLTCNDPNPGDKSTVTITVNGADGTEKGSKTIAVKSAFAGIPVGKSAAVEVDLKMDDGDTFTVTADGVAPFTSDDALAQDATVFVVGDSTASVYGDDRYPRKGWAQLLDHYFSGVTVTDLALSGRSSSSFKKDAEFATLKASIKKGDYLIIQFGHNDNSDDRFTDPATDRFTDGSYKQSMLEYVELAWEKGAHPIIATSISRRRTSDEGLEKYVSAARELAAELSIPCVDLYADTTAWIAEVGLEGAKDLFNYVKPHDSRFIDYAPFAQSEFYNKGSEDDTHINVNGADLIAQFAVDALREQLHPLTAALTTYRSQPLPAYATAVDAAAQAQPAPTQPQPTPTQAPQPPQEGPAASRFVDVGAGHWAKSAVDYVTGEGIFNGVSADRFEPETPMTRGMMVTVLYRLSGVQAQGVNPFYDVLPDQWYTDAVIWAAASGIARGYDTGAFGPGDSITREQLAIMAYRYAQAVGAVTGSGAGDTLACSDANELNAWSAGAVSWLMGRGVINGKPGNLFDPNALASRAEVAAVFQRLVPVLIAAAG